VLTYYASVLRVLPYLDGHQVVADIWAVGPSRLRLFIGGEAASVLWADGYEVRSGCVILPQAMKGTVLFGVAKTDLRSETFAGLVEELDVVDQVADLVSQLPPEENPCYGGEQA
jgi:hypothetical protein